MSKLLALCAFAVVTMASACSGETIKAKTPEKSPSSNAVVKTSAEAARLSSSNEAVANPLRAPQRGQRGSSDDDMIVINRSAKVLEDKQNQSLDLLARCAGENYNDTSKEANGEQSPADCSSPSEENEKQ